MLNAKRFFATAAIVLVSLALLNVVGGPAVAISVILVAVAVLIPIK